jgi:glycosyltransferase involved in cell wall biosynthesis
MIKNKKKINNDQLIIGISGNRSSSGDKGFDLVEEACRITNSQLITSKQDLSSGHLSKEQMSDYYNKLDIYCCMSKSEGLNNCIMEAGATAVPVITTRTGAVEEMIEDGKTGFIIERNVQALVDKINFFKNNREAIKTFGNDFKKIIDDNWSWDSKIEDYRKMFNMFFINLV